MISREELLASHPAGFLEWFEKDGCPGHAGVQSVAWQYALEYQAERCAAAESENDVLIDKANAAESERDEACGHAQDYLNHWSRVKEENAALKKAARALLNRGQRKMVWAERLALEALL